MHDRVLSAVLFMAIGIATVLVAAAAIPDGLGAPGPWARSASAQAMAVMVGAAGAVVADSMWGP